MKITFAKRNEQGDKEDDHQHHHHEPGQIDRQPGRAGQLSAEGSLGKPGEAEPKSDHNVSIIARGSTDK